MFGRYLFYLFGVLEFILCMTISVSMSAKVSQLSYKASKLLFSLAIVVDIIALFSDLLVALECVKYSEKNDEDGSSNPHWFTMTKSSGLVASFS